MELINGLHNIAARHHGCVATIGAFDGVHLGHQTVLKALTDKAKALRLPSLLITLEPLPREFFAPREAPARLMSFREKYIALRELNIDRMLCIRFTEEVSHIEAETFIRKILVGKLGVRHILTGDDLRFGHDQRGDFDLLRRLGSELGFGVDSAPTFSLDKRRVSSTRLREALARSEFVCAEKMLGRTYSISGKVIVGKKLGRKFGAPTANMRLHRHRAPLSGVYAVSVVFDDINADGKEGELLTPRGGVANIGVRPTVEDRIQALLEVHLFDCAENLYGRRLKVSFFSKVREEQKFPSIEELKHYIQRDIATARRHWTQRCAARNGKKPRAD